MDARDKKFVLDVVSGCIEHKNLLDIVINVFYCQNGKYLTRGYRSQFASKLLDSYSKLDYFKWTQNAKKDLDNNTNCFSVICYLITFALDDLGLQGFSNIVKSLDFEKMQTVRNLVSDYSTIDAL